MNKELERHWAPTEKVYVHKDKTTGLYGEMLIISPDDLYTIEDFVLIDKKDLEQYFNPTEEETE